MSFGTWNLFLIQQIRCGFLCTIRYFFQSSFFHIYHRMIEPAPCNVNWSESGNRVLLGLMFRYVQISVSDLLPEFFCKLIFPKYYLSKKLKLNYLQNYLFYIFAVYIMTLSEKSSSTFYTCTYFPPNTQRNGKGICTNPAPGLTWISRKYFDQ